MAQTDYLATGVFSCPHSFRTITLLLWFHGVRIRRCCCDTNQLYSDGYFFLFFDFNLHGLVSFVFLSIYTLGPKFWEDHLLRSGAGEWFWPHKPRPFGRDIEGREGRGRVAENLQIDEANDGHPARNLYLHLYKGLSG